MIRKVVITMPVHNRKEETLRCLNSLHRSDLTGLDVHIIIVDDGSTDGTENAVKDTYPQVEIIKGDGNLWYTAGTNRGLEAALKLKPDYILAINNDSIFEAQCLNRMVECADRFPRTVVGALLLNREAPHRVFQVAPVWSFWRGGLVHLNHQTVWTVPCDPWEVSIIVGNCVLYPVAAIQEAGLMDEKRLKQFGDAEYTPRMRKLGWRLVIEPKARVFCKPNDIVTGFRRLGLQKKLKEALLNPYSSYSIRRKAITNMVNAPNPFVGLLSLGIFYARVVLSINAEGLWGQRRQETPLVESLRDRIAK